MSCGSDRGFKWFQVVQRTKCFVVSSGSEEKVLCLFTSFSNFVILEKVIKRKMSSIGSNPVTNCKLII